MDLWEIYKSFQNKELRGKKIKAGKNKFLKKLEEAEKKEKELSKKTAAK
ncbi:MAG: hypothetical protein V1770_06810 [bacterium]